MTREKFQKTVSERFQNTDSGFGNMTQRERILLQVASNVYDGVVKLSVIPGVVCSVLSKDGSYIKFECSDLGGKSGKSLTKSNFNTVIDWLNKEKEKYPDVF